MQDVERTLLTILKKVQGGKAPTGAWLDEPERNQQVEPDPEPLTETERELLRRPKFNPLFPPGIHPPPLFPPPARAPPP